MAHYWTWFFLFLNPTKLSLCSSLQLPATLLSSTCLARPQVALTWAPQRRSPSRSSDGRRRDPPSGRGRTPAVQQGAQAVRHSAGTRGMWRFYAERIHQGSKRALFQYWLCESSAHRFCVYVAFGASTLIHRFSYIHLSVI